MVRIGRLFLVALFFKVVPIYDASSAIQACFTPHQRCLPLILKEIESARRRIWVQGYSFTSKPIAEALVKAHAAGLDVQVILDKSQERAAYSMLSLIHHHAVPVFIDWRPAIAHNKIMIIDDETLITGSYNWTAAAENRNAENILIIKQEPQTFQLYVQNFEHRKEASKALPKG